MNAFSLSIRRKLEAGLIPVIPDIKLRSPKEGELLQGRDPVALALLLERLGAPALSVVTEERQFGGSLELLQQVSAAVSLPVLRKDFITTAEDLRRTTACGAQAVLLIAAYLSPKQLRELYEEALRLGLEPLVETHTKQELILAATLGAQLVGINNRDILTLEQDEGSVSRTLELAALVPPNVLLISESGIKTPEHAKKARLAGAGAVLVGTALWQARDIDEFYLSMCRGGFKDAADQDQNLRAETGC